MGGDVKALAGREVWFVVGSQDLYGDQVLQTVAEHVEAIAGSLNASPSIPVDVVARRVVTSPESIEDVCRAATSSPACVGVVVWMHTFSPSRMWIAGLKALGKPLLHLHTQFNRDLPWAEIDMDFMNLNQSAHGDREFAHIETRMGIDRTTVVGHWEDPEVQERIGVWTRAAVGWQEMRALKVARFGDNMRQVAVTEGDKVEAQVRLGSQVNGYGVNDLVHAVQAAPDDAVDRLVATYESAYAVAPSLVSTGVQRSSLREAARIEVGLRTFLEAGRFGAFTDTFEDLGDLRQLPGIAVQRLMADGFGFGAEGDWKTAILVRVMKVMATGLSGGTSFMEDYTYDLGSSRPQVLGAHMLEVCPSITAETPRCEVHPLSIGGKEDPVRLVFTARPGPAIVLGLLDLGERFRLVLNEVDVVQPPADLPRLPVARALWEPRPNFRIAAEAWLEAGAPHHTSLSTALRREHLEDLARMAGVELVVIGDNTTAEEVRKELRWNHAYYQAVRRI